MEIRVTVGGPGLGPGEPETLLERAGRGLVADTRDAAGAGLSVARRLMDEQLGGLQVEEPLGGGACFTITFPRSSRDAGDPKQDLTGAGRI